MYVGLYMELSRRHWLRIRGQNRLELLIMESSVYTWQWSLRERMDSAINLMKTPTFPWLSQGLQSQSTHFWWNDGGRGQAQWVLKVSWRIKDAKYKQCLGRDKTEAGHGIMKKFYFKDEIDLIMFRCWRETTKLDERYRKDKENYTKGEPIRWGKQGLWHHWRMRLQVWGGSFSFVRGWKMERREDSW